MSYSVEKDAFFFVVSEDQGMQAMIAAALNTEGYYRILAFARAKDIVETANAVLADIYIIDNDLSGMTGLELCERLQPNHKYIPCILLNAPRLPAKWIHRPIWTLQIPFTLEELFQRVQEALRFVSPLAFVQKNGSTHLSTKH